MVPLQLELDGLPGTRDNLLKRSEYIEHVRNLHRDELLELSKGGSGGNANALSGKRERRGNNKGSSRQTTKEREAVSASARVLAGIDVPNWPTAIFVDAAEQVELLNGDDKDLVNFVQRQFGENAPVGLHRAEHMQLFTPVLVFDDLQISERSRVHRLCRELGLVSASVVSKKSMVNAEDENIAQTDVQEDQ
jgi:hypothetical protein